MAHPIVYSPSTEAKRCVLTPQFNSSPHRCRKCTATAVVADPDYYVPQTMRGGIRRTTVPHIRFLQRKCTANAPTLSSQDPTPVLIPHSVTELIAHNGQEPTPPHRSHPPIARPHQGRRPRSHPCLSQRSFCLCRCDRRTHRRLYHQIPFSTGCQSA